MPHYRTVLFLLLICSTTVTAGQQEQQLLDEAKRIVFLGDSITFSGMYVACFDAATGREIWKNGIYFPENIAFTERYEENLLGGVVVLGANALTTDGKKRFIRDVVAKAEPVKDNRDWQDVLYRPLLGRKLAKPEGGLVPVTLIPYYAWANRGEAYMQVWTPLAR